MKAEIIISILCLVVCVAGTTFSSDGKVIYEGAPSGLEGERRYMPVVARRFITARDPPAEDKYDPCRNKKCSEGYTCKAVTNRYLLQVSIGLCVRNNLTRIVDAVIGPSLCAVHLVGGNIINCKTQEEWEAVGHVQCGTRNTAANMQLHEAKVHHHCHRRGYDVQHVFLHAEITCCPSSEFTVPPVDPTNADDDFHQDVSGKRMASIVTFSAGIAAFGLIILVIGTIACRKRRYSRDTKPSGGAVKSNMFFINHNSEAFEESALDPKKPLVMNMQVGLPTPPYVVKNPVYSTE